MGNQDFEDLARQIVQVHYNDNIAAIGDGIDKSDIYIVWLVKALQNNKAMLATTRPDGLYFEVTYNGDMNVCYLDRYRKEENITIYGDE